MNSIHSKKNSFQKLAADQVGLEHYTSEFKNFLITSPGSNFRQVSEGSIGDKAAELLYKTKQLHAIGFKTSERTVLTDGYFAEFFQRNDLGMNLSTVEISPDIENKIIHGSFSQEEFRALVEVCKEYEDKQPLAIRSSAVGDARGTGIYHSAFVENTPAGVTRAIKQVLASYFSPDAVAFRSDAGIAEGFGVLLEPLIGMQHEFCFAPVLSGFGYTTTPRGAGYISAVPGLGGGVQSRDGESITRAQISEFNGNLGSYLYNEKRKIFLQGAEVRRSALLKTDRDLGGYNTDFMGLGFVEGNEFQAAHVHHGCLNFSAEINTALGSLNLLPLFDMMDQMEKAFAAPQYFEWALTFEADTPVFWITQIADVLPGADDLRINTGGQTVFTGHSVVGTGVVSCDTVVVCSNSRSIPALAAFNEQQQDYILVYNSSLTSAAGVDGVKLQYHHFNNASVLLEQQNIQHTGDPIAHFGGQLDMAKKLFAVLDSRFDQNWDLLQRLSGGEDEGLQIYTGALRVQASERENQLLVELVASS